MKDRTEPHKGRFRCECGKEYKAVVPTLEVVCTRSLFHKSRKSEPMKPVNE